MMRSLYSGVAGLKTHQTRMDVIGNNIANVNTTAFKSSNVTFSDIMYQTSQQASGASETTGRGGVNAKQTGLGATNSATKVSIDSSGAAQSTGNAFDIMLNDTNSTNFFVVSNGVSNVFTRDGSFYIDGAGNLCMASTGYNVMGWQAVETKNNDGTTTVSIKKDTVSALRIMQASNMTSPPEATTLGYCAGIVDKNSTDVTNSGQVMNLVFYDALGYSYTAKFAVKSSDEAGTGTNGLSEIDSGIYHVTLTDVLDSNGESLFDVDGDGECDLTPEFLTKALFDYNLTDKDGDDHITDTTGHTQNTDTGDWEITDPDYSDDATESLILKFSTATGKFQYIGESGATEAVLNLKFLNSDIISSGGIEVAATDIKLSAGGTDTSGAVNNMRTILDGLNYEVEDGKYRFENINIDFTETKNYDNGGTSTISMNKGSVADATTGAGKKIGALTGVSVDQSGKIYGTYDNGNTQLLGQIAVAQFTNASGLEALGNNCYATTLNSGEFDGIGVEVDADGGSMTTGALEMSNVDLASEFTSMITTQRGFQANSRIITTSDTMLEELLNLKR